jgi:formyl-CoA transferase
VGNDDQWQRFCAVASLDTIARDERFRTNAGRVTNYAHLLPVLTKTLRERTTDEWVSALRDAGIPAGAVRDVGEALSDPQLQAREMIARIDHDARKALQLLGVPVKLSETPGGVRRPPPKLGEHTDRVLAELGLG